MITLEGLVIAVGTNRATATFQRFNTLYDAKHGSYMESVMKQGWIKYAVRRENVWRKYSLFAVYQFEQEMYKKAQ